MWKSALNLRISTCRAFLDTTKQNKFALRKRLFLSEAYRCQEVWEKRLASPLLQKIQLDEFYQELDGKFTTVGKASAIDIDLFANAVQDESHIDELEDLLHKLRLCPNTSDTLPSTHHSVVRTYVSLRKYDELLRVLNDRLNYGIFPDDYCSALLLDTFLKEKNYTAAARVCVLHMLQEDWSDPVISHLALYACYMYLKNPGPWYSPQELELEEEVKDEGEEVKVRVSFLRNPYFDDHFDVRDPQLLVGKTLASLGSIFPDAIGRTYQLVGWGLFKKWEKAISHLELMLKEKQKPAIYKEGLEMFKDAFKELKDDDSENETKKRIMKLVNELESSGLVADDDLQETILNKVKSVVSSKETELIEKQCKTYSEWETLRKNLLQQQLDELNRQQRLAKVKEEKENLEKREEVIFFFDNEEKLELTIEENRRHQKRNFGNKVNPKEKDENYIPPEV